MTDPWQYWKDALAGKKPQMNEGTPHAGFYRRVWKEAYGGKRKMEPVAYWLDDDGVMQCRVGDKDLTPMQGADIWTRCGNHPVPEDWYREVAEENKPWRDEHELVPMGRNTGRGHNNPPEDLSFEGLRDEIQELSRAASQRLDGPPVETQAEADKVSNLADRMAELWKQVEAQRKMERDPHNEALKLIQQKWLPLLLAAELYETLKNKLLTPWHKKQKEAAALAVQEAVAAGDQVMEMPRIRSGTRGRAMSLRTSRRAEITDYAQCLAFFAEGEAIRSAVQHLADKAIKAGVTVPGTKVVEDETVV